jgi:chemotaxis protein CheX
VSGVIGLSGKPGGTCAVSMPQSLAVRTVANMMYIETGTPEESEIRDGVGEMINMIAGRAKAILSTTEYKFDITLPTIISGGPHELFQRVNSVCMVVQFETAGHGEFTLDVCFAQ